MVGDWRPLARGLAFAAPLLTTSTRSRSGGDRRDGASVGLGEELLELDDDPGDLAGGDEALGVGGGDGERQAAALDLVEDRFRLDRLADGGGGEGVDLDG